MTIIGIDPGLRSGAWAAITHSGTLIGCADIPASGDRINARALRDTLLQVSDPRDSTVIVIEQVGAMPGQGITSTGRFLRAAGAIEAVCELLSDELVFVRPQAWKAHHGLGSSKSKSCELAIRRFPAAAGYITRAKDHGKAEALLIAAYWMDTELQS